MGYLNGTEIQRMDMPAGDVDYETLAPFTISGDEELDWVETSVDPALPLTGTNVISAEVHLGGRASQA